MDLAGYERIIARRPRALKSRIGEQFVSSLKKGVVDIAAAAASLSPVDIKNALSGMYSNVVAVSLNEAVWLLYNRSMARTVNHAFSELLQRSDKMRTVFTNPGAVADIIGQLEVDYFEVDARFMDNPSRAPWVVVSAEKIAAWAFDLGCPESLSFWLKTSICNLMPIHMRDEFSVNEGSYEFIRENTAFSQAVQRVLDWNAYHSSIKLEADLPIFDTAVPLKDIYIVPRARSYWTDSSFDPAGHPSPLVAAKNFSSMDNAFKKDECINLHEALHKWRETLSGEDGPQERMRIVCGSPGCGKSSFATVFASELIENGGNVLLVRLGRIGHFDESKNIEDVLAHYFIKRLKIFKESPFSGETQARQLTIILDGLDELAGPMEQGREVSHSFIRAVLSLLEDYDHVTSDVAVVLTGRKLLFPVHASVGGYKSPPLLMLPFVIDEEDRDTSFYDVTQHQSVEKLTEKEFERWLDFLRSKKLIEVFDDFEPFYPPETEDRFWVDKFTELGIGELYQELLAHSLMVRRDDRDSWWKKWGRINNLKYDSTPEEIKTNTELNTITTEPLLNFLAAQLVDNGVFEIGEGFTANLLYETVLGKMFTREDGKRHFFFEQLNLSEDDFFRLLEQVAVTGWRNGNERRVVRKLLTSELSHLVGKFAEEDMGITRLLLLFYFSSSYYEEDECIEFTHRTFAEYLLARALAREAKELHHRYHKRWTDGEAAVELKTLMEWTEFCGGGELTTKVHSLLVEEIAGLGDRNFVAQIQETLRDIFELALKDGFPVEMQTTKNFPQSDMMFEPSRLSFKQMEYRSRCAEVNLLGVLNACARYTGERYEISFGEGLDGAANWMRKHAGLVSGVTDDEMGIVVGGSVQSDRIIGRCCSHMNLMEQNFTAQDFCFMDLDNCSFASSELSMAQLRGASLEGADLSNLSMEGGNGHQLICIGADLTDAVMTDCSLFDAKFDGAVCVNANFSLSVMAGASFRGADLSGAKLCDAYLDYADFSGAILTGADFTGASCEETIFDEGQLDGAIFGDRL